MIDTHNHILDHMDDGPLNREETLEMCRIAWEDGIRTIVATPHSFDGRFVNQPEKIRSVVADLNQELIASGIDVRIMAGMEVRVSADLFQSLADGQLLPLNGRTHLLVEFHPQYIPAGFENLVHHFTELGYSIIWAHPEKNLLIQRNPSYVFSLLERFDPWAVLIQVTADSLTGQSGFWAMRTARLLLKCGLVHLIATDAHSATRRPPRLARAVEKAAKTVGKEKAEMMVHDIPLAVLEGRDFPESWDPHRTEGLVEDFLIACVTYWINPSMGLPINSDSAILGQEFRQITIGSGKLKGLLVTLFVAAMVMSMLAPGIAQAGPADRRNEPQLDHQLMAFKDTGMWYFLCEAPLVQDHVPPSYLTAWPPPPPCGPMPLMAPPVMGKRR